MVYGPAASSGGGMTTLVIAIIGTAVVVWFFLLPSFRSRARGHVQAMQEYISPETVEKSDVVTPAAEPVKTEPVEAAKQLGFDVGEFTSRFGSATPPLQLDAAADRPAIESK